MFRFFKFFSQYKLSLSKVDKDWVEFTFSWFIEIFGIDEKRVTPFVLPKEKSNQLNVLVNNEELSEILDLFKSSIGLGNLNIEITTFEDFNYSKRNSSFLVGDVYSKLSDNEIIYQENGNVDKVTVYIGKTCQENEFLFFCILGCELLRVKFQVEKLLDPSDPVFQQVIDLAFIYFGFGVFFSNGLISSNKFGGIDKIGAIPEPVANYAISLLSYISKFNIEHISSYFKYPTSILNNYKYLVKTNDTRLTESKVSECNGNYKYYSNLEVAIKAKNYTDIFKICNMLLEKDNTNVFVYNVKALTYLKEKSYQYAENEFKTILSIQPSDYESLSYVGYCQVNQGNKDLGLENIHKAFMYNAKSAICARNFGYSLLLSNEYNEAFKNLKLAKTIDPLVPLINYFLAYYFLKTGDKNLAQFEYKIYLQKGEINDSILNLDF